VNNKDFENLAWEKSKNFKINKPLAKILANNKKNQNQLTKTSSSSKNNITTTASKYISTKKSIKSTATTTNSSKKYNNNNSNLFLFEEEIMMKKKSTIMYVSNEYFDFYDDLTEIYFQVLQNLLIKRFVLLNFVESNIKKSRNYTKNNVSIFLLKNPYKLIFNPPNKFCELLSCSHYF
jgi:hypothetical protein